MRVIRDAKKLEAHTYNKCRSTKVFPKKDRGGLPTRMVNEAIAILANLYEANDLDLRDQRERYLRLSKQRAALTQCNLLLHHIQVVYHNNQIDADAFDYWTNLANSVRNQAAKWHKNDKERSQKLEQG